MNAHIGDRNVKVSLVDGDIYQVDEITENKIEVASTRTKRGIAAGDNILPIYIIAATGIRVYQQFMTF